MSVIAVEGLVKEYGGQRAVDGLSFSVAEGEIYALLGHNGAGKSTTIEILEGHRQRTAGSATVLGVDPGAAGADFRDRIGIVLQTSGVESQLSAREAIEVYGRPYRRRRPTDEVLGLTGLAEIADQRIGTLSGGQRRRVDLALGIVGYPDLIFLDEPTTGFDPVARRESWEMVRGLCSQGTTVVLTTHYLDEAEHLANRVGVIANGKMLVEGTPDQLLSTSTETTIAFDRPADGQAAALASVLGDFAGTVDAESSRWSLRTENPTADLHRLTGWALNHGVELVGLTVQRPTLEDVFVHLAGNGGSR